MTVRSVSFRPQTTGTSTSSTPTDNRPPQGGPGGPGGPGGKADFVARIREQLASGASTATSTEQSALYGEAESLLSQIEAAQSSGTSETEVRALMEQLRPKLDELGLAPKHGGPRDGFDGRQGPPGPPPEIVSTAAEALGIAEEELQSQLQSGATLAELSESQGYDVEELKSVLSSKISEKFPDATAEMLARIAEHMVSGSPPPRPEEEGEENYALPPFKASSTQASIAV